MGKRTFVFHKGDMVRFEVWRSYGICGGWDYPLTFTIRECIEDWCEQYGFCFTGMKVTNQDAETRDSLAASGAYYDSGSFWFEQ